jgi:hypothetical protein
MDRLLNGTMHYANESGQSQSTPPNRRQTQDIMAPALKNIRSDRAIYTCSINMLIVINTFVYYKRL